MNKNKPNTSQERISYRTMFTEFIKDEESSKYNTENTYELLVRLPFYFPVKKSKNSQIDAQNRFNYLYKIYTPDYYNKKLLFPNDFKTDEFNPYMYLQNLSKNKETIQNALQILTEFQSFIDDYTFHDDNPHYLNGYYFSNSKILNKFYEFKKIERETFNFDKLLVLYSLTYFTFSLEHASRLDLYKAACSYFYNAKLEFPIIKEELLRELINMIDRFADFLLLEAEYPWDFEKIRHKEARKYLLSSYAELSFFDEDPYELYEIDSYRTYSEI